MFGNVVVNQEVMETMWGNNEMLVTGNLKDLDLTPLLQQLTMPVLLTSGRFDTLTPTFMNMVHNSIPHSRWVLFEHSAHMPHIAEAYLAAVREFLSVQKWQKPL